MNKFKHIICLFWLIVTTSPVLASQQDCIELNNDQAAIEALIDSGKYRFANKKSNEKIDFSYEANLSFQQYLDYAANAIEAGNPRAAMPCSVVTQTYQQLAKRNNWSNTPTVSQLVAPFELKQNNNEKAVLLIHGLTDSPFSYHDLAQFFYQQGFTVRTLLLPGHGIAPSSLLDVSYQQWQQATQYAIERTVADFEQVYLGGFSTGGALIFDYLMQQEVADKKIKGLFMWSPASKAKSDLAWLAKYVNYIPFVNWIDLAADVDFAKYESFPYNAGAQVHSLMSRIVGSSAMKNRKMHNIPIFVVASEHDQTIETKQTFALVQDWLTPFSKKGMNAAQNRFIYYGEKGNVPLALRANMQVVSPKCDTAAVCQNILTVAHTATTNSPLNPHYGLSGKYRNCDHYLQDKVTYRACKQGSQIRHGELTPENLASTEVIQRLTFNPYYQSMLAELQQFISLQ